MSLNRKKQPAVSELDHVLISRPERSLMPNGVPLNIIRAGNQDVVRLDLIFEAGSWRQKHKLQALFTNRMLREGTLSYSSLGIAGRLDYYGAWLELANSPEYAFITLYSLNKYFNETLEVLESIVKEPLFPQKELNTVIETNLQQYQVNSSRVDFIANRALLTALLGNQHPSTRFANEDDYRKISPRMLMEYYEEFYHAENCSVYLSGKVNDNIILQVEKTFGIGGFGSHVPPLPRHLPEAVSQPGKRFFTERADAMQSSVKMGMTSILRSHPDYLKLRVLLTIFGGYFGSRLMSNIREDKGYTYGISSGMYFYPGTGMIVITTETGNEFVEPLVAEVYREIDKLQTELVAADELSTVKNYMLGEIYRSYESPFSLSDAWIFIETAKLDDDFFTASTDAVKTATPQELRNLASRYLCKESLKEIVVGKKIS